MIGKTLAHYEITSQLGKGGMGEVYQAKDRKLGRDVAIKVLPEEFAKDADRVTRFQREAKLLASLNHPNIAAIYGLEESGGTGFLVLELVEGGTLADQIKKGPIPVEEALKLALQIAEALEAAHEKGVIHRDLKPANIKVTPEGKVKVLDFGLAKAFAGEQAELILSNSPTLSDAATQQGVILGTAAYMSPEQARGKAVDKRADIWAFGCVLYEMLTGQAAFQGEDVTEILAAVVKSSVNLEMLPANLHPRVHEAITRCLQKDLKKRYRDIAEARYEIEQALADASGVLVQPLATVEPRRKPQKIIPWATATLLLGAIIAGLAVWYLKPPEPKRVMRFEYELPAGQQLDGTGHPALAISPDGSKFVYNTDSGLYLRSMDQPAAKLILGPESFPRQPFFSPDGQWVGYWSQMENQLKRISISGGAPVSVTNSGNPVLPSWGNDGMIVYGGQSGAGKIMRVPANGGAPEPLFEIQGKALFAPQILPGGKYVLVSQYDSGEYQVIVQDLKSRQGKKLMTVQGTVARYLSTGHIAYMVGNSLFAVPFNVDKLELAGGPVSMVEGIVWEGSTAAPQFAISEAGTLVYIPGTRSGVYENTLVWVDRNGKEEPLIIPANEYRHPRISPDGKRVALSVGATTTRDIWVWDFGLKTLTRLTFDKGEDSRPLWTPDGKRIAFHTHQKDARGSIYWKTADGTGEDEAIGSYPGFEIFPSSWSGDGKTLLVTAGYAGTAIDIGAQSIEGDKKYRPLLKEAYAEAQAHISRDGRWMAYASDESGQTQVYVRPFPELNKGRWQVSANGGESPLWSPDGQELFYRNGDLVMAVPVKTEPVFSHEAAKILFRGIYLSGWPFDAWDIHPDGKRFLMIRKPAAQSTATGPRKINIVLNWFEELKQRVPVK
jgi:serine/threonine protein kinase